MEATCTSETSAATHIWVDTTPGIHTAPVRGDDGDQSSSRSLGDMADAIPVKRRRRFRKVADVPAGTACACCHSCEGTVARWVDCRTPGGKSEVLHLDCAPRWWPDDSTA
jgi:hypothetical protein